MGHSPTTPTGRALKLTFVVHSPICFSECVCWHAFICIQQENKHSCPPLLEDAIGSLYLHVLYGFLSVCSVAQAFLATSCVIKEELHLLTARSDLKLGALPLTCVQFIMRREDTWVFAKAERKVNREKLEMVWKSVCLVQFVSNNPLKASEGEEWRETTKSGLGWCRQLLAETRSL